MKIGTYNTLKILRFTAHGAILDGDGRDVLMPKKYTKEEQHVGDEVCVFVYLDQDGRPVATTEKPAAQVGEFAFLRTAWTNRFGAFMDWGLTKDLFVPFHEQERRFVQNRSYLIYIYIDDRTGRIVGTSKLDRYISDERPPYRDGQEVDIIVWKHTELGFKVIVDGRYEGLVYRNEVFRPLNVGFRTTGYIKRVRPDGKIDVGLQLAVDRQVDSVSEDLLKRLQDTGGHLPYGDKTPADVVYRTFHVSKNVFKRAIARLYRERIITIGDSGIHLNVED